MVHCMFCRYCAWHRTLNADFPPPEKNCIQVYVQVIPFACSFSPAAESPRPKFDANDSTKRSRFPERHRPAFSKRKQKPVDKPAAESTLH